MPASSLYTESAADPDTMAQWGGLIGAVWDQLRYILSKGARRFTKVVSTQ